MRFQLAALSVLCRWSITTTTSAFTLFVTPPHGRALVAISNNPNMFKPIIYSQLQQQTRLFMTVPGDDEESNNVGDNDEYDDWYADFDPADFDNVVEQHMSSDNGYGSNGRYQSNRRGGGDNSRYNSRTGHDYTRDVEADDSNVSIDVINKLLSSRLQARKTGDFDTADAIRHDLLHEHGVQVWDDEKLWRSGCNPDSGSGMKWGPGGGTKRSQGRRGSNQRQDSFGPHGHDYNLSPDAGPNVSQFTEEEIHNMLAERLQYKMSRDFASADSIQDDLIKGGVYVHDGYKEWRADGQTFGESFRGDGRPGRERGSRLDRNRPYKESPHSIADDGLDMQVIKDLVAQRVEAKMIRDYGTADAIRDELRHDYNVYVDDRKREFSVGGDFGLDTRMASDRPYSRSTASQDCAENDYIQSEVERRAQARKERDFDVADNIREDLLGNWDVVIDDKLRQWSVGGRFGISSSSPSSRGGRDSDPLRPYSRRGGGDLTEEQVAQIMALIEERNDCKKEKAFGKADCIRDNLKEDFCVRIDDNNREWMVVTDEYVMAPKSDVAPDLLEYITTKIGERALAKLNKDYEVADAIRDALSDDYNVYIDDRVREFRIEGAVPILDEPVTKEGDDDTDNEDFVVDLISELNEEDAAKLPDKRASPIFVTDKQIDTALGNDDDDATITPVAAEEEDLASLTVVELKEKLREAGLRVSGKKAELIERLQTPSP